METLKEHVLSQDDYLLSESMDNTNQHSVNNLLMNYLSMYFLDFLLQGNTLPKDKFKKIWKQLLDHYRSASETKDIKLNDVMRYIDSKVKQN
jgi:hypothetical protein